MAHSPTFGLGNAVSRIALTLVHRPQTTDALASGEVKRNGCKLVLESEDVPAANPEPNESAATVAKAAEAGVSFPQSVGRSTAHADPEASIPQFKSPKPVKRPPPFPKEIDANDIADYLASESDFAFEIRVVKELRRLEFEVEHGGTYIDDVSGKPRQFDVRATLANDIRVIRLATECKNLKSTFPLLVSCLPRTPDEAFQDISLSVNTKVFTFPDSPQRDSSLRLPALEPSLKTLRIYGSNCLYHAEMPVGKVVAQIGRDTNGQFTVNDSEVYGKWSQALSSADDLVSMAGGAAEQTPANARLSCVIPALVVPDNTLWMCGFDFDGNRVINPVQCDRIQLYVAKRPACEERGLPHSIGQPYTLSHLEIVTFTGLKDLVTALTAHRLLMPDDVGKPLINGLIIDPRKNTTLGEFGQRADDGSDGEGHVDDGYDPEADE